MLTGNLGDRTGIPSLMCDSDGETSVVGVRVHVVELNGIESFPRAVLDPLAHQWQQQVSTSNVEPALVRPALEPLTKHNGRQLVKVPAVVLR